MSPHRQIHYEFNHLSTFSSIRPYTVYSINRTTDSSRLYHLIDLAKESKLFTIDTENDFPSHRPALIQIEFIQPDSTVLLIEMFHLPHEASSDSFYLIRELFSHIFHPSKIIQAWGDVIMELRPFIQYGLFTSDHLERIRQVNIQQLFKRLYNDRYGHEENCPLSFNHPDHPSCTCFHRPYKNQHEKWSLQRAIAMTFNRFLDKRLTLSPWRLGLDLSLFSHLPSVGVNDPTRRNNIRYQRKYRLRLIKYAVNDCLATTELSMAASEGDYVQFLERNISEPMSYQID